MLALKLVEFQLTSNSMDNTSGAPSAWLLNRTKTVVNRKRIGNPQKSDFGARFLDVQVDLLDGPVCSQKSSEDVARIDGLGSLNWLTSDL